MSSGCKVSIIIEENHQDKRGGRKLKYGTYVTLHTGGSRRSSGGMPPGKFFFNGAKSCKLGHFFFFCQALGGGWPRWPLPLGAAYGVGGGGECPTPTIFANR